MSQRKRVDGKAAIHANKLKVSSFCKENLFRGTALI